MKGQGYPIIVGFVGLFIFAILYIPLAHVFNSFFFPWAQANSGDADLLSTTVWVKTVIDNWPMLILLAGFFLYVLVQSQKREAYY